MWEDTVAIPVGAPHPENAHAFINYIFDPEAGKHIAETIQYATPNAKAKDLMEEQYKTNPAIYPPADIIAKCEYAAYLGEEGTRMRDEVWTSVQAATSFATSSQFWGGDSLLALFVAYSTNVLLVLRQRTGIMQLGRLAK